MLIPLILSTLSHSQCIPLAQSKHCKELAQYNIIPILSNSNQRQLFSNIAEFDTYLEQNAGKPFYGDRCSNYNSQPPSTIKYSKSVGCLMAINVAIENRPQCNNSTEIKVSLCKSSISLNSKDIKLRIDNTCRGNSLFPEYVKMLESASDTNCLLAFGDEVRLKCGLEVDQGTAFCLANPNELCCKSTSNIVGVSDSLSTTVSGVAGTVTSKPASTTTSDSLVSATSNANTNTNSSTGKSLDPLLIFGAAGIVLFIAIGIAFYFIMRKPKPAESISGYDENQTKAYGDNNNTGLNEDSIHVAAFRYQANLFDELTLDVGDKILILEKFDDGWGLGENQTSGKQGVFPLNCLEEYGADSDSKSQTSSYRVSSMYGDNTTISRYSGYQSNI